VSCSLFGQQHGLWPHAGCAGVTLVVCAAVRAVCARVCWCVDAAVGFGAVGSQGASNLHSAYGSSRFVSMLQGGFGWVFLSGPAGADWCNLSLTTLCKCTAAAWYNTVVPGLLPTGEARCFPHATLMHTPCLPMLCHAALLRPMCVRLGFPPVVGGVPCMPAARVSAFGWVFAASGCNAMPHACLLHGMLLHAQHASCSRSCVSKRAPCVGRAGNVSFTVIWPHNGYPSTEWCVTAAATVRPRCLVCSWPCATCAAFSANVHKACPARAGAGAVGCGSACPAVLSQQS
jgi:hypothetical protein